MHELDYDMENTTNKNVKHGFLKTNLVQILTAAFTCLFFLTGFYYTTNFKNESQDVAIEQLKSDVSKNKTGITKVKEQSLILIEQNKQIKQTLQEIKENQKELSREIIKAIKSQ